VREPPVILDQRKRADVGLGEEWFEAECGGCDRRWSGRGTSESRQALKRAQKHADRTGHLVSARHANRR
jgi:hypothetical protein